MLGLLLFSLLIVFTASQSSIPATSSYNRYISARFVNIVLSNPSGITFTDHYYTTTYASTITPADRVYYSTQNIDALIFNYPNPNNNSQISLEYYISQVNKTDSTLTTNIRGYFETPFFYNLDFRFLLVFNSNPWESDYMVIQYVNLLKGDKDQVINLPTNYTPNHSLKFSVMLRDAKAQFSKASLESDSNKFFIQWNYQLSNTTLTLSLVVPLYFQNGQYEIRYLVIAIDYTLLNQDFPKYRFDTTSYSGVGQQQFNVTLKYSLALSYNNDVFGLSQVQFTLKMNANFQFKLIYYGTEIGCQYIGDFNSYTNFTYAHTAFIYFDCPNAYYRLYNGTDNQCYSTCKASLYFDVSNQSCLACRFDCLTCNSATQCLSCNSTYRYFSNYSCLPLTGKYETDTTIPGNCSSSCYACLNSATNCTACAINKTETLSNNTCAPCNILFDGCNVCTQSYCIACMTNYTLVNATFCNLPCNDSNCAVCSNLDTSVCTLCKTPEYSISSNHKCLGLCGDGKIIDQACDDGNLINHDGCDSTCAVESGYTCYNKTSAQGFKYTHYCSYQRGIDFQIVSVEKLAHSNELSILISVSQYSQSFWRTKSVLSYCFVETPVPYRNMRVELQSSARTLQSKLSPVLASQYSTQSLFWITFQYLSSMQGKSVSLSFNFHNTTDLALAEIPVNQVNFVVQPGNNHYAHFYSSSTYERQRILEKGFMLIAIIALLMYAGSMVLGGKRIAAEQIMVLQLTYLSLLTLPALTPLQYSVSALSTAVNGVNILYDPALSPFNDVLSDSATKGAGMYSQFLYNFNMGILVIILPLLVGLGAFLASKLGSFSEAATRRVHKIYRLAMGEYTFTGLIFSGSIIGAAAVLEIRFGFKEISSTMGLASLIITALLLILYPIYLALRLCVPTQFQEYRSTLRQGRESTAFQMAYYLLGLLFAASFAGLSSFQYINCALAGICLALFCIITLKPLFKKQFDHYRTQLNLLTIAFAQIPFIYSRFNPSFEYAQESDLSLLLPVLLAFLMALNVLGNLAFFVYLAIKRIREGLVIKQMAEEKEAEKQTFQDLYKSSLISPLKYLKKPKFLNSFIEQSQQDDEERRQMIRKGCLDWKGGSILKPESEPAKAIILEQDYIHSRFNEINQLQAL